MVTQATSEAIGLASASAVPSTDGTLDLVDIVGPSEEHDETSCSGGSGEKKGKKGGKKEKEAVGCGSDAGGGKLSW
jgi:hypothetical protein